MAARSIWNGTLTFSEVAIPVKLFSAVEGHRIHFREVRLSDGCRIVHRRVGADSGREVPRERIAKAYETSRGHQVVLQDDEIAAARGSRPKVIEIEHFVAGEQIDPVYYDRPYILGAQSGGERSYRVLLAALERTGQVGIGRFVLRTREQLVALRSHHEALELYTMRFADEVLDRSDLKVQPLQRESSAKEIEMAERLIDTLATDWHAADHKDRYRQAVLELIDSKAAGNSIQVPPPKREHAPDDLLAALQQSLESGPHKGTPQLHSQRQRSTAPRKIKPKTRRRR